MFPDPSLNAKTCPHPSARQLSNCDRSPVFSKVLSLSDPIGSGITQKRFVWKRALPERKGIRHLIFRQNIEFVFCSKSFTCKKDHCGALNAVLPAKGASSSGKKERYTKKDLICGPENVKISKINSKPVHFWHLHDKKYGIHKALALGDSLSKSKVGSRCHWPSLRQFWIRFLWTQESRLSRFVSGHLGK